jgi:hypothetical protein
VVVVLVDGLAEGEGFARHPSMLLRGLKKLDLELDPVK